MKKNRLEWTVFGVSLLLILAITGVLLRQQFTGGSDPASLVTTAGDTITTPGGYAIAIDVRNEGDRTAEDVRLEVTLTSNGTVETGGAVIRYVPYRSSRRAWVAFTRDPREGDLRIRVRGYLEP